MALTAVNEQTFLQRAREAIQKAGGRMTNQRQVLIEVLAQSAELDESLDAEALYELAHKRDSGVSLATVYRTLRLLEAADLLQPRYHERDHERRYYQGVEAEPAYYFMCRVCHKTIPIHSNLIDSIQRQLAAELKLEVFSACICLEGICPECATTMNEEK
jgi:Fur family ferric uptake transcriptional regulator